VSVDQSVQSQYNCKIPEPVPVYSKCLSLEPVSSKCFSVESKVSHDKVIAPELPIPLSSNDQKMVKCETVFDQCVNFSDDKSVQMSFPCLNPIQSSLPSTLDPNVASRNVGHMVQSCSSDMCNVNEGSSDSPSITSENVNSMTQTIVSEVSNDMLLSNKLSSHFEHSSESSHEYVSKSVLCNQSVQTIESQNNPFFAAMYAKFKIYHGKVPFYECVNELSGKFSRFTQTIGCSVDNYLLDEKSTCSIFSDNFCDVDSCNSSDVPNEMVEMKNPNVHVDDSDFKPNCNLYGGSLWIYSLVNGVRCPLMIDTGSAISIFNHHFNSIVSPCSIKAKVANGDNMKLNGVAIVELQIGSFEMDAKVFVAPEVTDNLLGLDLLKLLNCSLDLVNMRLCMGDETVPLYNTSEISMIALVESLPLDPNNYPLPETISAQIVNVPPEFRSDVVNLLTEYAELFRTEPLGTSRRFEHRIELNDPEPVRMMPRRVPLTQYQPMKDEVERMLRLGVIRKSVSPYASPIVLVKKKSGEIRFCIDFRNLNSKTIPDAYPLPYVSDILGALQGAKFFTTLDLSSGFWQIKMREKDIYKTAFCIPNGHYEFLKMPFGLCNSVATFQRMMNELLEPMLHRGVVLFVDDVVVYSDTIPGLIERLRQVFELLRSDNLTLHPGKCVLFKTEVKVLGHRVSAEGIQPLNDKIEAIESWPTPKNKKETRSFLGLCSYYRQYVSEFAKIAAPLHKLTGKNAIWQWTDREAESFVNLKEALQTTPVLQLYDPNKPVMVDCDSSGYAIGGVLVQPDNDGNEKPVAYFSRCLNKAEAGYCTTRRELLAVIACLRHWRHYVLGRKVLVRTDHSSLTWLRSFKQPESQLARWFSELSQYNIEIVHRPGSKCANSDGLSRRPCAEKCTYCDRRDAREIELNVRHVRIQAEIDWVREQRNDPELLKFIQWKESGTKPPWETVSGDSPAVKRLWREWDVLVLRDGTLQRVFFKPVGERFQTLVPGQCRTEILKIIHEQGHFGIARTQISVADRFYWPSWRQDVKKFVSRCHVCHTRKGPHQRVQLPERKFITSEAFERIAVDICGPFPTTSRKNRYMLVVTDFFSKWVEPIAIENQEAVTVADALINEIISRFGVPAIIYSDRGAQFTSRLVQILCDRLHVKKVQTCPYRPSSNGQCERSNRSLIDALSKVIERENEWDRMLPIVAMYYRASCHRATGVSPALLALGRELRLPVDVMYPTGPVEKVSMPEYLEKLEERMNVAAEFARRHMEMDWQSRQNNNGFWSNYKDLDLDKNVYIFRPVIPRGKSFKLARHWWGPYKVLEKINSHLYRINMGGRNGVQVIHRAHIFQPHDIEEVEEGARNLPCQRRV
jgi:predicted aspartyl protease